MSDMNDDGRRQFTPEHAGTNDFENSRKSTLTRRHLLKMAGGALAFSLLSDLASPADLLAADNSGKPMKIVMLTGSPHRQGTSALLADEFVAAADGLGVEARVGERPEVVRLGAPLPGREGFEVEFPGCRPVPAGGRRKGNELQFFAHVRRFCRPYCRCRRPFFAASGRSKRTKQLKEAAPQIPFPSLFSGT